MSNAVIGIKETLEILASIELCSVAGIEIAKGGLGAEDIAPALELVKKSDVIIEGVKGLDLIDDEIKDLDQAELLQLGAAAFNMVKKIASAAKSKEA